MLLEYFSFNGSTHGCDIMHTEDQLHYLTRMLHEVIDTDFFQREGRQKFIKTAIGI